MGISGGDSAHLREWAECRATIGRLDTILQDLRKYGFTLIAGLLTAGSFIGYGSGHPNAGVGVFIAVMCLIAALFSVDIYYSVLQSAAVERALNLEEKANPQLADPQILITATISFRAMQARSRFVILGIYVFLLFVAGGLGVISAVSSGSLSPVLVIATLVIGVPLIVLTLVYWIYVARRTRLHREKPRVWPSEPPFNEPGSPPVWSTLTQKWSSRRGPQKQAGPSTRQN